MSRGIREDANVSPKPELIDPTSQKKSLFLGRIKKAYRVFRILSSFQVRIFFTYQKYQQKNSSRNKNSRRNKVKLFTSQSRLRDDSELLKNLASSGRAESKYRYKEYLQLLPILFGDTTLTLLFWSSSIQRARNSTPS